MGLAPRARPGGRPVCGLVWLSEARSVPGAGNGVRGDRAPEGAPPAPTRPALPERQLQKTGQGRTELLGSWKGLRDSQLSHLLQRRPKEQARSAAHIQVGTRLQSPICRQPRNFTRGFLASLQVGFVEGACYGTEYRVQTQVGLLAAGKSVLERQVMVGKERSFYSVSRQLGSWWTNVSKTIFSLQAKPEGFRGEGKGGRGEKGAACWRSRCPGA